MSTSAKGVTAENRTSHKLIVYILRLAWFQRYPKTNTETKATIKMQRKERFHNFDDGTNPIVLVGSHKHDQSTLDDHTEQPTTTKSTKIPPNHPIVITQAINRIHE